jgi:hypothetical protein
LDRLLERLVETPVRGFVYEAAGTVNPALLERGREAVTAAGDTWRIPVASILVDPGDHVIWSDPLDAWTESAFGCVLEMTNEPKSLNSDRN